MHPSHSYGGMFLALVKSLVLLAGLDSVSAYIMKCIPRKKAKEKVEFSLHAGNLINYYIT